MSGPGKSRDAVVVRARQIAEDRAAMAAMAAASSANAARVAAQLAHQRASRHPLGETTGGISAVDLITASGSAAALRETAAAADRRVTVSDQVLSEARRDVDAARAQRKAAERFAERRRQAEAIEAARRSQRVLDESATAGQAG
jgi:flagellar export protein FliJ